MSGIYRAINVSPQYNEGTTLHLLCFVMFWVLRFRKVGSLLNVAGRKRRLYWQVKPAVSSPYLDNWYDLHLYIQWEEIHIFVSIRNLSLYLLKVASDRPPRLASPRLTPGHNAPRRPVLGSQSKSPRFLMNLSIFNTRQDNQYRNITEFSNTINNGQLDLLDGPVRIPHVSNSRSNFSVYQWCSWPPIDFFHQ